MKKSRYVQLGIVAALFASCSQSEKPKPEGDWSEGGEKKVHYRTDSTQGYRSHSGFAHFMPIWFMMGGGMFGGRAGGYGTYDRNGQFSHPNAATVSKDGVTRGGFGSRARSSAG